MGGGEAKATVGLGLLGGEKGVEDLGEVIGRDAAAVVFDLDKMIGARGDVVVVGGGGIDIDGVGADIDMADIIDGIAGVDHEIEEDLLEMGAMKVRWRGVGLKVEVELDFVADEAIEHRFQVSQKGVDIHAGTILVGIAAVGEELFDEIAGVIAGLMDLEQVGIDGVIVGQLIEHQFGVADDEGQQVVEVMSNPVGEPAQGLHAVVDVELLLQILALLMVLLAKGAEVPDGGVPSAAIAVVGDHRSAKKGQFDFRLGGQLDGDQVLANTSGVKELLAMLIDDGTRAGMEEVEKRGLDQPVATGTEEFGGQKVGVFDDAIGRHDQQADGRCVVTLVEFLDLLALECALDALELDFATQFSVGELLEFSVRSSAFEKIFGTVPKVVIR